MTAICTSRLDALVDKGNLNSFRRVLIPSSPPMSQIRGVATLLRVCKEIWEVSKIDVPAEHERQWILLPELLASNQESKPAVEPVCTSDHALKQEGSAMQNHENVPSSSRLSSQTTSLVELDHLHRRRSRPLHRSRLARSLDSAQSRDATTRDRASSITVLVIIVIWLVHRTPRTISCR